MLIPYLAPKGGACSKGDPYQLAVKLRPAWGYELKFEAGKINGKQPVNIILGVSTEKCTQNLTSPKYTFS